MKPRRSKPEASQLSPGARAVLARTAAARVAIDAEIADVVVEGGPPERGAKRETGTSTWLDRDIVKQRHGGPGGLGSRGDAAAAELHDQAGTP